jgi:hypothetical protein
MAAALAGCRRVMDAMLDGRAPLLEIVETDARVQVEHEGSWGRVCVVRVCCARVLALVAARVAAAGAWPNGLGWAIITCTHTCTHLQPGWRSPRSPIQSSLRRLAAEKQWSLAGTGPASRRPALLHCYRRCTRQQRATLASCWVLRRLPYMQLQLKHSLLGLRRHAAACPANGTLTSCQAAGASGCTTSQRQPYCSSEMCSATVACVQPGTEAAPSNQSSSLYDGGCCAGGPTS